MPTDTHAQHHLGSPTLMHDSRPGLSRKCARSTSRELVQRPYSVVLRHDKPSRPTCRRCWLPDCAAMLRRSGSYGLRNRLHQAFRGLGGCLWTVFYSSEDAMHDHLDRDAPDQVRPGESMVRMSKEDFLRWEPRMRLKHEFVNGQVYLWPRLRTSYWRRTTRGTRWPTIRLDTLAVTASAGLARTGFRPVREPSETPSACSCV